jgi:hypothetical protein
LLLRRSLQGYLHSLRKLHVRLRGW